jgi:hypothetical protein
MGLINFLGLYCTKTDSDGHLGQFLISYNTVEADLTMIADGVVTEYSIMDQSNVLKGTRIKTPNLKVAKNNFSALPEDWTHSAPVHWQISNLKINQSVFSCDEYWNAECIKVYMT